MNTITIEVWDATGNKRQPVELPPDAAVNRTIAVLIEKMNLPRFSPDGQLMSYKFHHRASGRQLLDDETLASAGVQPGDVLRLQPEITAGGAAGLERSEAPVLQNQLILRRGIRENSAHNDPAVPEDCEDGFTKHSLIEPCPPGRSTSWPACSRSMT